MNKDFAIQLYSVRDFMDKDYIGTLEKISEMGYTGVEFAGFGGLTASDMKSHLDRLNLKAVSSHTGSDLMADDKLKEQIEYNAAIGSEYIICPWYDLKAADDVYRLAELLNHAAEETKKSGILVAYHNHSQEFDMVNGMYFFDLLMKETDPATVKMELDIFWAEHAGVPAIPYLKKHGARCDLIHLKQIDAEKKCVDLADGLIDMGEVIKTGRSLGAERFIVEQEEYEIDSLVSARNNAEHLKKIMG